MTDEPMRGERDSVDEILDGWARERPDLDFAPVGVVTRLARVRSYLDAGLVEVFATRDLSAADFLVVVTLRRSGRPFSLPQARLMDWLGLTSGTVSVRIDRLVRRGVVVREPDPDDARVQLVRLTDAGLALFDELAPVHLANEDRLLSALGPEERNVLAGLLRRLLASFENPAIDLTVPLGLQLEPTHRARARRLAVGLSDVAGLLVAEVVPGSPSARAGVGRGDLLVAAGGRAALGEQCLRSALAAAPRSGRLPLVLLRGETEVRATVHLVRSGAPSANSERPVPPG